MFAHTKRPTVPAMEDLMGVEHHVLDHGKVVLLDYMGSDACVAQAARTSYQRGTRSVSDDRALVRYLMRHRHSSPIEQAEIKLYVKLPIFVARQWIRHRTANVNEESARYSILASEFYVPDADQIREQSKTNRQGRGEPIHPYTASDLREDFESACANAFELYHSLLNDKGDGSPEYEDDPMVARELARTVLPVSTYTSWVWKIDLHNLLHFLSLRFDPHAQHEIRVYAEVIAGMVKAWCPLVWEAFEDYRLHAVTLSRMEADLLREFLAGLDANHRGFIDGLLTNLRAQVDAGTLSKREAAEFRARLLPGVVSP